LYDNPQFPFLAERKLEQVEFGVTKYLVGHRLKIQANLVHGNRIDLRRNASVETFWSAIFQMELGI
jgi:phosphate-selective porin OprO and OprP